jgi:hypothetical protein
MKETDHKDIVQGFNCLPFFWRYCYTFIKSFLIFVDHEVNDLNINTSKNFEKKEYLLEEKKLTDLALHNRV